MGIAPDLNVLIFAYKSSKLEHYLETQYKNNCRSAAQKLISSNEAIDALSVTKKFLDTLFTCCTFGFS